MSDKDTIVAVSSGAGQAGVAVIRISGEQASHVLSALGAVRQTPRRAELVSLRHPERGDVLDRALSLFFPAPHSFTGESVAELHIHGGRAVQAAVIDAILSTAPAVRVAEAGEFTRRAFRNGKLDLTEIAGLAALIDSETEWQRRQAMRLLEGELGRMVDAWRRPLVQALSCIDAVLDFADEGDVADEGVLAEVRALLSPVLAGMRDVLSTGTAGERLREGYRVAIIGPPNVGKSSLLNAIAGRDIAIVSDEAGTTRDVLELRCDIAGLPVTFYDTAGLRDTANPVEREGISRAHRTARDADIVLMLSPVDSALEQTEAVPTDAWQVTTMIDRAAASVSGRLAVSARTGAGIGALLETIGQHLKNEHGNEPSVISEARQRRAIEEASRTIDSVLQQINDVDAADVSEELLAESLRVTCRTLDQLIGKVKVDDVLDEIFGRFCIGK
jgi:tRNA modification GTPase